MGKIYRLFSCSKMSPKSKRNSLGFSYSTFFYFSLQEAQNMTNMAISKLVFYSLLIIIVPLTLYFSSKSIIFEGKSFFVLKGRKVDFFNLLNVCILFCLGYYGMSTSTSYFYAAIVAITSVHLVLILFIIVALGEGSAYKKPATKTD